MSLYHSKFLRSIVEHKVIILRYFARFENIVRRNIH